ncbi:MAG TPA: sulfatase-like hydrolase/transferase, partial [Bdellovibrionota bacterium]|nr:sulfatase-like hydrolase/transferase [Bdellovibrionota bacterium]
MTPSKKPTRKLELPTWLRRITHEGERWINIESPDWVEWTVVSFLLYSAFVLLRVQLVTDLDLTYKDALSKGLFMGLLQDLLVVCLPLSISMILSATLNAPRRVVWSLLAVSLWIITAANAMYFKFFGDPLQLWVVQNHWRDLTSVQGAATHLALAMPLILSGSLVVIMLAVLIFSYQREPKLRAEVLKRLRMQTGVAGVLILALVVVLRQSPDWMKRNFHDRLPWTLKGSVLSDQILTLWWDQVSERARLANLFKEGGMLQPDKDPTVRADAQKTLSQFRDLNRAVPVKEAHRDGWPLVHKISFSPKETREIRARLGLPLTGPINIAYLFIESGRFFEMTYPKLGRRLFPEMSRLMDEHAITFTQTYTVARSAAQTVRGMFSTLCSTLENIPGPATFLGNPDLPIVCIQDLLSKAGYQTAWSHSYPQTYQNMGYFESRHGVQQFYDQKYFMDQGIPRRGDDWGVEDGPFLHESFKVMQKLYAVKKPFYIS